MAANYTISIGFNTFFLFYSLLEMNYFIQRVTWSAAVVRHKPALHISNQRHLRKHSRTIWYHPEKIQIQNGNRKCHKKPPRQSPMNFIFKKHDPPKGWVGSGSHFQFRETLSPLATPALSSLNISFFLNSIFYFSSLFKEFRFLTFLNRVQFLWHIWNTQCYWIKLCN